MKTLIHHPPLVRPTHIPVLGGCQPNCGHTAEEHIAYDIGVYDGEHGTQTVPMDGMNTPNFSAWQNGASVGRMNRARREPSHIPINGLPSQRWFAPEWTLQVRASVLQHLCEIATLHAPGPSLHPEATIDTDLGTLHLSLHHAAAIIQPRNEFLRLTDISTQPEHRRRGLANALITWIWTLSDYFRIPVSLAAIPYATEPMDAYSLRQWLIHRGAAPQPGSPHHMIRRPGIHTADLTMDGASTPWRIGWNWFLGPPGGKFAGGPHLLYIFAEKNHRGHLIWKALHVTHYDGEVSATTTTLADMPGEWLPAQAPSPWPPTAPQPEPEPIMLTAA